MTHLDAAADPYLAIERKLYVERPLAPANRIVGRLELRPASTHLLLGGIGSGKTTQLLIARDQLNALDDTLAIYIDVSKKQHLTSLKPGILLALAGLALGDLPSSVTARSGDEEALGRFRRWAQGHMDGEYDDDDYETDPDWVPGIVIPPDIGLHPDLKSRLADFVTLRDSRAGTKHDLIFLLDSLDRIDDLATFSKLVEQDITALQSVGVGIVLVGPIRAMYGLDRLITERFDQLVHLPAADLDHDSKAFQFLIEVLRQRVPDDTLTVFAREVIARSSGGILRDLIQLGRLALEEAYLDGADQVTIPHAERAADAFGRALMIGLTQADLKVLERVRNSGAFVQTSEEDLALLATRRVIEYRNTGVRYAVHPTIAPLLAQLAGES